MAGIAAIGNDSAAIKCGTNSGRINAIAAELFVALLIFEILNKLYKTMKLPVVNYILPKYRNNYNNS